MTGGSLRDHETAKSWDQMSAALERAFRRAIGDAPFDPHIARELLMMRPHAAPVQRHGPTEALARLARTLGAAVKEIESMPEEARIALNIRPEALRRIMRDIRILRGAAGTADPAIRGGRPRKISATKIAERVGWHYMRMTGSAPTIIVRDGVAGGRFVELLKGVFAVLHVTASAEAQARSAIRSLRRKPTP